MVTIDQAMRGVAQYAENEIIPHLPTGKGIGAGIALALIMDGGKSRILAPEGFEFDIKDIVINAGAEMIVAIAGDIIRMPGLPKSPQALRIDVKDGAIDGLS